MSARWCWWRSSQELRRRIRSAAQALIDYARSQGIGELLATVLPENRTMLDLAERLGFTREQQVKDTDAVELRLRLRDKTA